MVHLILFIFVFTWSDLARGATLPLLPELRGLWMQARGVQELKSVEHQNDLLQALEDSDLVSKLRRAGADIEALRMGIVDSDAGKLSAVFESAILTPSRMSTEFLTFLRGKSDSKAGVALRDLLGRSGFAGRSLLSWELSQEQIREAFRDEPILRVFLHELPGLLSAMQAINANQITTQQFQKRVAANLFHNDGVGPNVLFPRGWWQITMTEGLVTNAILASSNQVLQSFFASTVFAGKTLGRVVRPRYPAPISVEGTFHAILDRMSQGTRGGLLKIFADRGSRLKDAAEVLQETSFGTHEQMLGLTIWIDFNSALTFDQKSVAKRVAQRFQLRLRQFNDFLRAHVTVTRADSRVTRLSLDYINATGIHVSQHFEYGPEEEGLPKAIEDLLLAEEALHGNPMNLSEAPLPGVSCSLFPNP